MPTETSLGNARSVSPPAGNTHTRATLMASDIRMNAGKCRADRNRTGACAQYSHEARHVECQLRSQTFAPAGGLAGPPPAGYHVSAGNQGAGQRVSR